ncbi:MAG: SIMPL domain-containing protein [bacterium]|nr:SIMPL domain-containing protein [bacterium]
MEQEKNICSDHGCFSVGKIYKAGGVVLILLAIFLFSKTISEVKGWRLIGKNIAPQTTITVSGKGEVVVKPDIATFSFGIQEESLVVGDAQESVAKSEKEVLDFLEKSGVAKDDIKVSGYNIYPRYDYLRSTIISGGKQSLAAYVVTESVEVKVRKTSDAGEIIGNLGEFGVTNLSGLTFGVDKQDDVVKQARDKAIADAKVNAKRLAKELGVSLARIVSFSENGGGYPAPMYYAKAEMAFQSGDSATPELPSGTNKITSSVSITYEIR